MIFGESTRLEWRFSLYGKRKCKMKVAYITAQAPYGKGETFIIEEMLAIKQSGIEIIIFPRNPTRNIFNKKAEKILINTIWIPLVNIQMITYFFGSFFKNRRLRKTCFKIIKDSRKISILAKNFLIMPKANYIAQRIKNSNVDHIHAHWGSTTSTMSYIISELTNIPWSFTLHRWDISENNILKLKCSSAKFTRCICEDGKFELIELLGSQFKNRIKIIHMGIQIPKVDTGLRKRNSRFIIICPANLRSKKGHCYLIKACKIVLDEGIKNYLCLIIGDGPLRSNLNSQIRKLNLSYYVKILKRMPHEKLMQMYEKKEVDVVILPSIVDKDGEREGIPVALMEAM
ncbi:MAG: glycosyltransferase family 4 protein, partial [Candidatus Hodarchaeota archaeon]